MLKTVIFALFAICTVLGKNLPSNFKVCKRDAKFDSCLKEAIQDALIKLPKGLPEFKLSPLEPLEVESMTIGAGTGPVQVVQKFKDVKIRGITKAKINNVKTNITDTSLVMDVDTMVDQLLVEADYDFNGKILIVPIVGTGKCTIALNNLQSLLTLIGKIEERSGKKYLVVEEVKVEQRPGLVHFNFENLFNGDKRLGDQVNKILNENQKEVYNDVRSGYEEFLQFVIKNVANQIFTQVPFDEIFLV